VGRLVLNVQDENDNPSVFGLSTALDDISFVFTLNQIFNWKLKRVPDLLCYQGKVVTRHVLYKGGGSGEDVHVFWNHPESSDWVSKDLSKGAGLFSEEAEDAPFLRFIRKPKNVDALIIIEPELSQNEMLILQKTMDTTSSIVGAKPIAWLGIKSRENLRFDTQKTEL
jgi:hypothetical protein